MEEPNAQFCEELKKNNITREKIDEAKKKLLGFLNSGEKLPKANPEEREKMNALIKFYKNKDEKNPKLTQKIFKLHIGHLITLRGSYFCFSFNRKGKSLN